MDRVLALHAGSRGFDFPRGHMSERFFRSSRQGYPHPVSSELENSGIRVAVSLNVGGGVRLIKPAKLCICTQNTTNTTRTGVYGNSSVPLSRSGNVVKRIGIHTEGSDYLSGCYIATGVTLVIVRYDKSLNYSRLSLSRNRRDLQKQFEISVLRHIRFAVLRKKQFEQPNFTNDYVIWLL